MGSRPLKRPAGKSQPGVLRDQPEDYGENGRFAAVTGGKLQRWAGVPLQP